MEQPLLPENISLINEDGIVASVEPIYLDNLECGLKLWLYSEGGEGFSPQQAQAFQQFVQLPKPLPAIYEKLNPYRPQREKLRFVALVVPSQTQTKKNIIYVLVDIQKRPIPLEMQLYFEDGELISAEPLNGNYIFDH